MSNPRQRSVAADLTSNPVLVGTVILAITMIGVFLSYNANKGLPFVPTYQIYVDVKDAAELVEGSEARIGGSRVGQVQEIEAQKSADGKSTYAHIKVALDKNREELPVDTTARVRPRSILGAKYVELRPGASSEGIPPGGTLSLRQALPAAELDESFNVFDQETGEGIRRTLKALGDSLAGRGTQLNELVVDTRRLLAPLQRVTATLADDSTDLAGFIRGASQTTSALAPVAQTLGDFIDNGATTLAAIDASGDSLGRTIDLLPVSETIGTRTLTRITPVLADAAAIARDIRPGTAILPEATRRLDEAVLAGTPILERTPLLAENLRKALRSLDLAALQPATSGSVRKLITTVVSLGDTLKTFLPAQQTCNLLGLVVRNLGSTTSEGDADGGWIRFLLMLPADEAFQRATPSENLHASYTPQANAQECEAGNEPYSVGQTIGSPPGLQPARTETTRPPASATARARAASLLKGAGE